MRVNFDSVLSKMCAVTKMWYYCQLTLTGKIAVINSLMASLFVYKMQVLPEMNFDKLAEIEGIIEDFLWKGKTSQDSIVYPDGE